MRELMHFPYERYEKLAEPLTVYYPTGSEEHARWVVQIIDRAGKQLTRLLGLPLPELEILLVDAADWDLAPHDEEDEQAPPYPYLTEVTTLPCLVVPPEIDAIFGEPTQEKLAFIFYQALAQAFLESDPRPWPEDSPLWADEWQFKFAALWLSHTLDGVEGVVNKDLHEQYAEIFETEPDGKTPDTVRGFDWYEDTTPEDYLGYVLILEQFAADLLAHSDPEILPRFLKLYRVERAVLLSEDVTTMLATALGSGGAEWLESLVYF
ncbi:hypothetical protein EPA93_20450 [Ktedonosporobacter rubrisoli]|uniref:Uncharacterized protein n=1 Tax=Ktedonosporobacter rubrisoli TaxID=2509675 RepID=A0A4V0YZ25_KTERU|nr:hypothetical protein [Ktedonosporobacter rubrisoli]QBD78241.1 hypothetical protein EPA93_20450 [Ktedonosporobacter rubrisoli]